MKKIVLFTAIVAIIFTLLSPKIFLVYIEKPMNNPEQTISFGGPIPFLKQTVQLSENTKDYPLEIKLQPLKETKTTFSFIPFLISFLISFILLFSIVGLFLKFMTKNEDRDHK